MRSSGVSPHSPASLPDRLGMRFAFGLLALVYLLSFALLRGWGWIPALAATEWVSLYFLRKRYGRGGGDPSFRMEPHIFAHFVPSRRHPDISSAGFRITQAGRGSPAQDGEGAPAVYLAGDCTLFEDHLPVEETFAFQLNALLPDCLVLNAGAPHYTALHSYNRFVVDWVQGCRPDAVLFFSAANDVLSFIHHKQGSFRPDHMHMYRPWKPDGELYNRLMRMPSATLRLILFYFLCGGKKLGWEESAEEPSPVFQEPASTAKARQLFNPAAFTTCLELFRGTCEGLGVQLILTTFPYQKQDMLQEPRKTYAWGIDLLNEQIRQFARRRSLELIDLAAEMAVDPSDIRNKWHYTLDGNRKRARVVADHLRKSAAGRSLPSDAALHR